LRPSDGWVDDPSDPQYNRLVTLPYPARHEAMWREDHLYDLVVLIGYNTDPPLPARGSAIFLHVVHTGYATDGCVSLPVADLLRVLRWLDPAAEPRIVMAPRQALGRY